MQAMHYCSCLKLQLGKRFGPTLMIGEELTHQLAHYNFKVEGNPLIMTRIALLHTILSSTKTTDGYSKIIVKADFDRMKGALKAQLVEVEKLLKDAWDTVCSSSSNKWACVASGRFNVRMILLLLGKHDSFHDLVALFAEELAGNFASKPSAAASTSSSSKIENLLEASAADVAQIQHSHIKLGCKQLG